MQPEQVDLFQAQPLTKQKRRERPPGHVIVLNAIRAAGSLGLTVDEVEKLTYLRHQTASARVHQLMRRGVIRAKGTRPTSSGRAAQVWVEVAR